jgi:hypothetical protein
MAVRLLEPGIRFLLESELGPVGRDLRRRAENVTEEATQNASGDVIGILTGDLHSGIRYEIQDTGDGLQAVVKTDAEHNGFAYPAWHDRNGRPWLTNALRDGLGR